MEKSNTKNINMQIDEKVWQKVGIMAAETGLPKKEIVKVALMNFWLAHKEAKKEN